MPNTKMIVNFDSEKLSAIEQFSPKDAESIGRELEATLDKIYKKSVPAPVREYIENKGKNSRMNPKPKQNKPQTPPISPRVGHSDT